MAHIANLESRGRPMSGLLDFLIGLSVFFPLFLSFESPILINMGHGETDELAYPLSMFFLPISIILALGRYRNFSSTRSPVTPILATLFVVFGLVASLASTMASGQPAIVYGIQWVMPFLWIPYFATILRSPAFKPFMNGLGMGAMFGGVYIFSAGMAEMLLFGGLADAGRMSQNAVIPGQYQLYVYTPTIVGYGALFYNIIADIRGRRLIPLSIGINIAALLALFFMAAREGILIYILGSLAYFASKSGRRMGIAMAAGGVTALLVFFNFHAINRFLVAQGIRVFDKFARLGEQGEQLGSRDITIGQYLGVIRDNPIFGSGFLPPREIFVSLQIEYPSAHNFYIDALAWIGSFGAIVLFATLGIGLVSAFRIVYRVYANGGLMNLVEPKAKLLFGAGLCLLLLLLFSNNVNVPLRQPLLSPFFAFVFTLVVFHRDFSPWPPATLFGRRGAAGVARGARQPSGVVQAPNE